MPFRNQVVAGTALVRDAIHSPEFNAGTTGWSINKDGSAEFNDVTIRGGLIVTNNAESANYVAGTSGWQLRANGTAEFNGDVTVNNAQISTGLAPNARVVIDDSTYVSPAISFFDGYTDGAVIFGANDGSQVGLHFYTSELAGTGTNGLGMDLAANFFSVQHEGGVAGFSVGLDPTETAFPGGLNGVDGAFPYGIFNSARGNYMPEVADGKVGTGTTATAIGTADTNIGAANIVNTPVISDRAYMVFIQIDYFRSSVGALARLDMKLWNGAVGGTQLGGTARIPMAGPVSTVRRTAIGMFMFRAAADQTIANLNVSLATTDATVGQNWTAEVNAGYVAAVLEFGDANNISNL